VYEGPKMVRRQQGDMQWKHHGINKENEQQGKPCSLALQHAYA